MRDLVQRAINARPELTAELRQRGMFRPEEEAELLRCHPEQKQCRPLGTVSFATLLAQCDTQLAARPVLRNVLDYKELAWLDRVLRFQKLNGKREELARIVERAIEGRQGNVRSHR
ncbi:MAG: hypothetical protein ACLQOO_23220 [Terriglobia bacterium]